MYMWGRGGYGAIHVHVGAWRIWSYTCTCGGVEDMELYMYMWGRGGYGAIHVHVGAWRIWSYTCTCGGVEDMELYMYMWGRGGYGAIHVHVHVGLLCRRTHTLCIDGIHNESINQI